MNQKKKTVKKTNKRQKTRNNQPARAVKEYSAGGFVYRMTPAGPEFLLIRDHKDRWSIPKGKIESEETPEQAAVREIQEETSLQTLLIRDKLDKIYFFYRLKSKLIFMTTWVFLVEALIGSEPIGVEEGKYWITEAKWFSVEEARAAMEHKDLKILLDVAIKKVMARVKVK